MYTDFENSLKEKSPAVYELLKKKSQNKWVITQGLRYTTTDKSSDSTDKERLSKLVKAYNL